MSSSSNNAAKRRMSDHATLAKKAAPEAVHAPRRKTMGASPANFTPSKHQVNLGSDHAAAYYFGDTPAKKHTPAVQKNTPAKLDEMNDTSMLSEGSTSSSDDSNDDVLNKSVLSDTTELTASNFVLQASSRQRLLELSRGGDNVMENVAPTNNEVTAAVTEKTAANGGDRRESIQSVDNTNSTIRTTAAGSTPAKPSPSLRSRLGESPSSLKKLSSSLRKSKEQNEQVATHRSAFRSTSGGNGGAVSFMLPTQSPATKASSSEDTTVEIETDKPLGDLLNNLKEPAAGTETSSSQVAQGACLSPSSTIASNTSHVKGTPRATSTSLSSLREATPHPKKDGMNDESFSSPTSTKADEESHFRLNSSAGGGSHKKLTPTKLSQSPRRVVNPESVDSPARNTRSAQKKASSPAKSSGVSKMNIDSEPQVAAGAKRSRDSVEGETVIGEATLSIRPGNVGRLSEVTLSPSLSKIKRSRRSSIAPLPTPAAIDDSESVHSSSTASTTDLNFLLGGPFQPAVAGAKETVAGGMRSVAPSPATANISVPRSILNSSRRTVPGSHQSRKSVVFGSPEAAEYRIGSPSVSLTPMPRGTAKAMFTMPSTRSQSSDSTVSEMEDETVEMEAALMQNVVAAEKRTSESNVEQQQPEDMDTSGIEEDENTPATKNGGGPPLGQPEEDETVELETNIEGLFSSAFGSPNSNASMLHQSGEKNTAADMDTSPAGSVDMTDAQSIASIASSRSGKSEDLEASSQKLNFEGQLSESPKDDEMTVGTFGDSIRESIGTAAGQGDEEDNTIELEADLTSLLASTGGGTTRQTPKPVTLAKKFPTIDSSLVPHTDRMSFGDALVGNNNEKASEGDDTFTEGSLTKELETNMESLIQATGGGANTPSASRRRSSHRFSLTPGSKVNLSVDNMDADMHDTENTEATDNAKDSEEIEEAVLELDSKELMAAAGLPTSPSALEISDMLANESTNSENFRNPLVAEAMAGFLFAVCGEVEMKAESSSDGNSCFNAIAEENSAQLLELQKALRSSDALTAAQAKDELKRLAQSAQAFVEFEWHSWEVQVVDSLAKALDGIAGEFEESEERLMSSMTLTDDALDAVSLMEGRAVQRARRQSMSRRKTTSQALETEIALLEQDLAREKASLEAIQAKERAQIAGKVAIRDHLALSEEVKPSTALAESLQHRFLSLNGMRSWSPLVIDQSNIVVGFIGASSKTCIKVGFSFSKSGEVTCQAVVEPSLFKQRRGKKLKLTPLITEFLVANIETMVESINKTNLNRGSDIVGFLQQLEMLHGRLETTASEIFGLQRRYGTLLEADPSVGFLLSVDFTSRSDDSTALRATFDLNASTYPFAPLNISLLDDREGKVDVDSMRRQLVKNAKPGMGYLSRTCDTIAAFLR